MASPSIDFNEPNLAVRIEQLSQFDLDQLPFGVILLDRDGTVKFYSETEARMSGYGRIPIGQNLFKISECFGSPDFHDRVMEAMELGRLDLEFEWPHDFADPNRKLRIRVQSARSGGMWLFIERVKLTDA